MLARVAVVFGLTACGFTVDATGIDAGANDAHDGAVDTAVDAPADPCFAVEVAASGSHVCARMGNGDVWCWGHNPRGAVGIAPQASCMGVACNPMPEKVTLPPALALGLGDEHTCAATATDTYCWGANDLGQFGNGGPADSSVPTVILLRAGATAIAGGKTHTCTLHGGAVKCSGENTMGEVGNGSMTMATMPATTVASGMDALATGFQHACAISDGFLFCWGTNADQQIDTTGGTVLTPRLVVGVMMVVDASGGTKHTCAVQAGGDMRCWGDNGQGQLGTGNTSSVTGHATPIVAGVVRVSAGVTHTCALAAGGTPYCWGEGYTAMPTAVTLPRPATSIAAGSYHDCFTLDDGAVYCRGWNAYGQLGTGTTDSSISTAPSKVQLCP